jgi:pyruvate formate lyase activating enzyme
MSVGRIFDIQRYSLDDGPGVRTVVFLKGCNLSCQWCHNPESINRERLLFFKESRCTSCGECVTICPNDVFSIVDRKLEIARDHCVKCGDCVQSCPEQALEIVGSDIEPEELVSELLKDREYYNATQGGVTFSGGEPLLQADFVADAAALLREKSINVAIETNGTIPFERIKHVVKNVDLFFIDLKHIDVRKNRLFTGDKNVKVFENIQEISRHSNVIIRIPVIPNFNQTKPELQQMLDVCYELGCSSVELLPYHSYASGKYASLGLENKYDQIESLKRDDVVTLLSQLETYGLEINVQQSIFIGRVE